MTETLGARFADALAAKDFDAIAGLLHDQVDLKGLTPGRVWEAVGPTDVNEVLQQWFTADDDIQQLLETRSGTVGDRRHVSYRLAVENTDGQFEVEQQVYYDVVGERISLLRILCSGYRPRPDGRS